MRTTTFDFGEFSSAVASRKNDGTISFLTIDPGLDGFEGAYLFADRELGRVVSVTLWRDAETAAASEAVVRGHLEHYEEIMGRGWTMETFDVTLARPALG